MGSKITDYTSTSIAAPCESQRTSIIKRQGNGTACHVWIIGPRLVKVHELAARTMRSGAPQIPGSRSARLHPIDSVFPLDPHSCSSRFFRGCMLLLLGHELTGVRTIVGVRLMNGPGPASPKLQGIAPARLGCGAQTTRSTNYRVPKIRCRATHLSAVPAARCPSHSRMTGPTCRSSTGFEGGAARHP